jgi:HEAT repeat protein
MPTFSQQNQSAEQDSLTAARQQLERADAAARQPLDHSPTADLPQSRAGLVQNPAVEAGDLPTVAAVLEGEDAMARAATRQALRNMVLTLDTVAARKRKVDATMEQLSRELRQMRARNRQRIVWKIIVGLVFLYVIFGTHFHFFNWWWIFLGGGGAAAADERASKRREAASALHAAGEPRAVGVLAIALRDGDAAVQRVAEQALRDLLPRVQASDAPYITAEQMAALLELAELGNGRMQSALLKALEQIGDEQAIPVVEYLADNGSPSVRDQARECLPYLTERVRLAHEQATLLRGSASPAIAAAPEQLLRPASATETSHPEQLLRPTQTT